MNTVPLNRNRPAVMALPSTGKLVVMLNFT